MSTAPLVLAACTCWRARLRVVVDGDAQELGVGEMIALGRGVPHEVTALEDAAFLLTIAITGATTLVSYQATWKDRLGLRPRLWMRRSRHRPHLHDKPESVPRPGLITGCSSTPPAAVVCPSRRFGP